MINGFEEEVLKEKENIEEKDGKYVVTCGWCGEKFRSQVLLKAWNREGVHRSKKHIQEEGKLPKPEKGRDTTKSIVDLWSEKLDKENQNDDDASVSVLKTVFEIARINYENQGKL